MSNLLAEREYSSKNSENLSPFRRVYRFSGNSVVNFAKKEFELKKTFPLDTSSFAISTFGKSKNGMALNSTYYLSGGVVSLTLNPNETYAEISITHNSSKGLEEITRKLSLPDCSIEAVGKMNVPVCTFT